MKYYSDFKKKEILQYTATWLNKDIIKTAQYKKQFMNKGEKKNPQKNIANQAQQHIKRIIYQDQLRPFSVIQDQLNIQKSINVIDYINKLKKTHIHTHTHNYTKTCRKASHKNPVPIHNEHSE